MYQFEVWPLSGHRCAAQPASAQQGSPIIPIPSTALFLLLSLHRNRVFRSSAFALLAGLLVAAMTGCGGITYNASASQKSPGSTATAATLTLVSCGVQSLTGGQTQACSVFLSDTATSATTVSLTSSNAALTLPSSVVVQAGQKTAEFAIATQAVTNPVDVTITGKAQGVTETDVITLNPIAQSSSTPTAALSNVTCGSQSLTGPATMACSVSLTGAAAQQTSVTLSSGSSALTVPASVSVDSGKSSAAFNLTATAVTATQKATLTATANGVTKSDTLILYPVSSPTSSPVATLSKVSCNSQTVTGPATESCAVSFTSAATTKTLVQLSSNNTSLKTPNSVTVAAGNTGTSFSVTVSAVSTSQSATLTATAAGVRKTEVLTLSPAPSSPIPVVNLSGLSCGTDSITGAQTQVCTVSLSAVAATQTIVKLSSSSTSLRVPASVTISQAKSSATFSVTASAVKTAQKVTLTATADGSSMSDIIALNPIAASTPTLSNLSCGTQSLTGAQTKGCTVALSAAATSQIVVALSSSSTSLAVPSSVTIAKGSTSAAFTATASAVKTSLKATLTASANGVSQTDVITLYPAQAAVPALSKLACGTQTLVPPSTEACAVYLSSAAVSGTVVTLSSNKTVLQVPSSVTIAAGSTSASFSAKALAVTTTQSVTLTATSNGVSLTDVLQLQGTTTSQPPSTPSQVQLSWDAPAATADPIAGYHVYRSTGGGSNYTLISALDTSTTYTDSTVQSATTYDYVVKSVDASGMESSPSNPISVSIP